MTNLKFIDIFTPYLLRPKHATFWYLIYVFQVITNCVHFLHLVSR